MDDSNDRLIARPDPVEIPSSSPPAAIPLRSSSSFPSGRVNFLPAIDRHTLQSYINDLYDCAEAGQDQLASYCAIHDQLRAQEIRGARLERQLHDVQELARPIRQYVNERYNALRNSLADAEKKNDDFQEELAVQAERLQEIPILKSSILQLKKTRHSEQEKHRRQLASLENELQSAIASSKEADDRAKLQIEEAKTRFATRQSAIMRELAMTQRDLGTVKTERDRLTAQLSDIKSQHDRFKSELADRDADRGRLSQKISALEVERDQALQSKNSLFARLTEVVASVSPSVLPAPAESSPKNFPRQPKRSPPASPSRESQAKRARYIGSSPRRSASPGLFGSRSSSSESSEDSDPKDSSSDETDDSLLAALSSSRLTARRRNTSSPKKPSSTPTRPPVNVNSSSPEHEPHDNTSGVSLVDLFGEPSSDSESDLSLSGDPRSPRNSLLTPADFVALSDTRIPRDRWIPGYRDRVSRSAVDVFPWSSRRVSLISVSELDID
uniref:Lebercilin domain-containing protein n=1 Tax=Peronospora matthiolae TaxID=2874970 RepID=A0AAV1T6J0_9STRA